MVARKAALDNSANVAGIITIDALHRGAIIAQNIGKITAFGSELIPGFFNTVADIVLRPTISSFAGGSILGSLVGSLFTSLVYTVIYAAIRPVMANIVGLDDAATRDLRPTSPTITAMENTYDGLPHANVYSTIGKKDAIFRLGFSLIYHDEYFELGMRLKAVVKGVAKICALIGYNWIVKTSAGRSCHKIDGALGSIDDRWVQWTLNGDKSLPFDGFLPNRDEQYAGIAPMDPHNIHVDGPNHLNVQYEQRVGIPALVAAMRSIDMRSR